MLRRCVEGVIPVGEGTILEGRFRLLNRIGSGGMAEVWRAIDTTLDAEVAVKVMHARLAADSSLRARFENEATNTRRSRSEHVVEILELVADAALPFFVMPVLRGHPLDEHLRHAGGGLQFNAAREILVQLLRALAVAHENGVVHRDVKPNNIFLERPRGGGKRVVKLLDFGVAWDDQRSVALTSVGVVVGTPAYMAPEVRVSDPGCQRPCADVYAAGIVTYEMLTGRHPQIEFGDKPTPLHETERKSDVPVAFSQAIDRALAVDYRERFASAAEFLTAVEGGGSADEAAAKSAAQPRQWRLAMARVRGWWGRRRAGKGEPHE